MNKYLPHAYVIPEDDADRQLADGFVLHDAVTRQIRVMPIADGWLNVLATFQAEYIKPLRDYPLGHVVLLIDFDNRVDERRTRFDKGIPDDLRPRVFLIGPKHEPEILKSALKRLPFEQIGTHLAEECRLGTADFWAHEQLEHNEAERRRMVAIGRPFTF